MPFRQYEGKLETKTPNSKQQPSAMAEKGSATRRYNIVPMENSTGQTQEERMAPYLADPKVQVPMQVVSEITHNC